MDNKILEIFIPGPAGRLEAKYYKSKKPTSPIALVLQPHPQYGGTMNNKVVVETFQTFMENDFSVCRVNFRGVGKSDGEFDNGQGELADAAAALDWLERENFDNSQCWVSGFSFGSLIAMQLLMRRPEINRFISGLRINSCIAIKDPKEKPETHHCELSKFSLSNQSRAAAASASSPWPLSNSPSLLPTPLKLTLQTEKSLSINV